MMASMGVYSDLCPNLFDQRRTVPRDNECLSCIDLNNKLKCALDEISSLNLILQLSQNELTSDHVLVSSINPSSSEQENHEVSNHKNWIEVNSKHCSNLYSCRKQNSTPVNQSILTSNNYAHLINLQDPTVNANAKAASELGLLYDLQNEDQQSELINAEEKSNHHIPVILNRKLHSKVVEESVNCANKRNPRLVNKVLVNNLPLTGNLGLQTPNKSKSRVTILNDSHLKGCTVKINICLSDTFRTVGWIKPGALTEEILDKPTVDLVNLKKSDVIVLIAGANEV
jgi:hypothetical protein